MKSNSFASLEPKPMRLAGLFLATAFFATSSAFALETKMQAMVRENGKLVQKEVTLTDLNSADAFDGKYFKIVKGDSEDNIPVSFSTPTPAQQSTPDSPDIRLKAATVYNAFTVSRLYFKNLLTTVGGLAEAETSYLDEPITIRLEMAEVYSEAVHYNAQIPIHNGALTIPASDPNIKSDVNPRTQKPIADWGRETWFFAPKKETSFATAQLIGDTIGQGTFRLEILEQLLSEDITLAVKEKILNQFYAVVFAENVGFSVAVSELGIPLISKFLSFLPTHVYLDAAMLPEIISNEYAHHALFKWLGLRQRSHIVEGYPHYYAAKIWGLTALQADAQSYSKGYAARDSKSTVKYSADQEYGPFAATSSFTFATLAQIEREIGVDEGLLINTRAIITPYFVGDSPLTFVGSESDLQTIFSSALLGAAQDYGKNPAREEQLIHDVLHFRQM